MIVREQWESVDNNHQLLPKKALLAINVLAEPLDSHNHQLARKISDLNAIDKFNWLTINPGWMYYYVDNAADFLSSFPFQYVSIIYNDSHDEVKQFIWEINKDFNL